MVWVKVTDSQVEKNHEFSHTGKIFREIDSLVTSLL